MCMCKMGNICLSSHPSKEPEEEELKHLCECFIQEHCTVSNSAWELNDVVFEAYKRYVFKKTGKRIYSGACAPYEKALLMQKCHWVHGDKFTIVVGLKLHSWITKEEAFEQLPD